MLTMEVMLVYTEPIYIFTGSIIILSYHITQAGISVLAIYKKEGN